MFQMHSLVFYLCIPAKLGQRLQIPDYFSFFFDRA